MRTAGTPVRLAAVGKRYTQYVDAPMLITTLSQLRSSTRTHLWALRDIDLEVASGECLGIIGRNGSGKSTLLQLLAGVTQPTEGSVTVRGRVAPLLSVGVGFHPELTGRENVYVNGTILGLARAEIDRRFDAIVAFAELEEFIDTPVKFYSSGMYVRLGFAVALEAHPDILLVDEVLAVGDLAFQMRCYDRMAEIRARGATVILVTHNLNLLRNLATRALLLSQAHLLTDGGTAEAVETYHKLVGEDREPDRLDAGSTADLDERGHITDFRLVSGGAATTYVAAGEWAGFRVRLYFDRDCDGPVLSLAIETAAGLVISVPETCWQPGENVRVGEHVEVYFEVRLDLPSASYRASAHLRDATGAPVAHHATAPVFYVAGRRGITGLVDLGGQIRLTRLA